MIYHSSRVLTFAVMPVILCLLWLTIGLSQDSVPIDFREIAEHLVNRRSLTTEGSVEYKCFRFRSTIDQFAELENLVMELQGIVPSSFRQTLQMWLDASMPAEREAWSGRCVFSGSKWLDRKQRIAGVDNAEQHLVTANQTAGSITPLIRQRQLTYSDGMVETSVENGLRLIRKPALTTLHPMATVEVSL